MRRQQVSVVLDLHDNGHSSTLARAKTFREKFELFSFCELVDSKLLRHQNLREKQCHQGD